MCRREGEGVGGVCRRVGVGVGGWGGSEGVGRGVGWGWVVESSHRLLGCLLVYGLATWLSVVSSATVFPVIHSEIIHGSRLLSV